MEFRCEDLAGHGLVLLSLSAPQYATLLADIRRLENPVEGRGPSLDAATAQTVSRFQFGERAANSIRRRLIDAEQRA